MKYIGIDMGQSKIEGILTTENPTEVLEKIRIPTEKDEGYEHVKGNFLKIIEQLKKGQDDIQGIGIGIPGSLYPGTDIVRNASTDCLVGKPFQAHLREETGIPVFIENDANCFALSETLLGAAQGHRVVFGIILGSGLGGGIVMDGKVWNGAHGNAAEFGHSTIDYKGALCWCGKRGCLEQYISGFGVERMYRETTGIHLPLKKIYEKFQNKDADAEKTIRDFIRLYGVGVANLINCFDPDALVLGGGASNLPILYTDGLESIKKEIFNDELKIPVLKNQLGDSSGVFGAVLVAKERTKSFNQ